MMHSNLVERMKNYQMVFTLVSKEVIFGYYVKPDGLTKRLVHNDLATNRALFMLLLSIYRSSTST